MYYIFVILRIDGDTFATSVFLYHHPEDGCISDRNILVKMLKKQKYFVLVRCGPWLSVRYTEHCCILCVQLSVHCTELLYFCVQLSVHCTELLYFVCSAVCTLYRTAVFCVFSCLYVVQNCYILCSDVCTLYRIAVFCAFSCLYIVQNCYILCVHLSVHCTELLYFVCSAVCTLYRTALFCVFSCPTETVQVAEGRMLSSPGLRLLVT